MDEEGEGAKETPRCETESAARRSVRIYGQTVQTGQTDRADRRRDSGADYENGTRTGTLDRQWGMDKVFF